MRKVFLLVFLLVATMLSAQSDELTSALEKAGKNRPNLEEVLKHYQKDKTDSLKYRAACFLIENMPAHYTYSGAAIDTFYTVMRSVFAGSKNKGGQYYTATYDSILGKLEPEFNVAPIVKDIENVTAKYLIQNIDEAFEMREMPWNKKIPFELFCEYVLPYRADNEPLSNWRKLFKNRRPDKMDVQRSYPNSSFLYGLCNELNKNFVDNLYIPSSFMPEFPLTMLDTMKSGSCREYSNQGLAATRACGIPVAIDFVPQWARRSMGHEWNVLLPREDMPHPFTVNKIPGSHLYGIYEEVIPKVYRKTYKIQRESLYFLAKDEVIPPLFNNPCIKDVTAQYAEVTDLNISPFAEIKNNSRFAYLGVFDNAEWSIVQWGERKDGSVVFKDMGKGCVYLPVFYNAKMGTTIPMEYPVLCELERNRVLKPDLKKKQTMRLTRKYRSSKNLEDCASYILGGQFQVANQLDFKDTLTLYTIDKQPENCFEKVEPKYKGKYSYFRFLAPRWNCNIAELVLFDEDGNRLPTDSIISTDKGRWGNVPEYAFDGNPLTNYSASQGNWAWVGLKFNNPVHISKIYYLPRNDDNFIRENETYELFYWDKQGWQSLGQQTGTLESHLIYKDAPTNALFLLRDLTKGKEERVFTYENGQQVWW